jgi:hypothetical protein
MFLEVIFNLGNVIFTYLQARDGYLSTHSIFCEEAEREEVCNWEVQEKGRFGGSL